MGSLGRVAWGAIAWSPVVCALVLWVGLLWSGVPADASDASIHAGWIAEFRQAVRGGDPYPRWLAGANGGLGSPAFHFYPPFPFWVAACLPGSVAHPAGIWNLLTACFVSGSAAAALAGFLLARTAGLAVRTAAGCGAVVAASPNALGCVVLTRGALAESWALAWVLMVIAAGLRAAKAGPRDAAPAASRLPGRVVAPVGGAVGGLLLTHLPTAGIFLPLWIVSVALGCPRRVPAAVAGCLAGAGLAAIHLFPIPVLLGATSGEFSPAFKGAQLERSFVFPELWSGRWEWPFDPPGRGVHRAWCVGVLVCVVGQAWLRGHRSSPAMRSVAGTGFLAAWVCLLMVTPVAQPLYDALPPLRRIQFAYRFLTPATAFLVLGWIGLIHGMPAGVRGFRATLFLVVAMVMGLTLALGFEACAPALSAGRTVVGNVQAGLEANGEYLPVGGSWDRARRFVAEDGAGGDPGVARVRLRRGREQVFEATGGGGRTVLPLFWFPGWAASDGTGRPLRVGRHPGTGLVTVDAPSGEDRRVLLRLERTTAERAGAGVSLLVGCGLIGVWIRGGRGTPPAAVGAAGRPGGRAGFTLLELLLVVAVVAVIAALLLPALASARRRASGVRCAGRVRQMGFALHLYGLDHAEFFPPNRDGRDVPLGETWVEGWLGVPGPDCTNVGFLRRSLLAPYLTAVEGWRCPSAGPVDVGGIRQPRVRHYSVNGFLGSPVVSPSASTYRRWHELVRPAPAEALTVVEERAETINDGAFALQWDFREDRPEAWILRDQPAVLHGRSGNLAFADGHVETHRWVEFRDPVGDRNDQPAPGHRDLRWLQVRATHREAGGTP